MPINSQHSLERALFALIVLAVFLLLGTKASPATRDNSVAGTAEALHLPVTTSSAAAARYFENGMRQYEAHRWNFALDNWREAVKLDPDFALAHAWICMTTVDPAEEASHRSQAKAAMKHASPGEQLVVQWMAGIHENRYLEGITAMNDVLAMYPRDKRLNFLFGYWLFRQDQYDMAERLTLKALSEDATYATAYNQMAYLYSRPGDYLIARER